MNTLQPHVAVIMYRGIHLPSYLEGCRYELVAADGRLAHYHLPESGTDIFHVPHPGSMNRIEGTEHFRDALKTAFQSRGLVAEFPRFLSGQKEGEQVVNYLMRTAPDPSEEFHKYKFVAWMAVELRKRDAFMSVPALIEVVNARGYTTNYGTAFEGGRGSYKLVSGTYHRMLEWDYPDDARAVAEAFRQPNFEYAYRVED